MNIYINSTLQQLDTNASITDALNQINVTAQKGIAIAVNNNVVPQNEWATYTLQPEDKIMLIKATQGG